MSGIYQKLQMTRMLEPVLYKISKFSICLCSKTIKNEKMEVFYI